MFNLFERVINSRILMLIYTYSNCVTDPLFKQTCSNNRRLKRRIKQKIKQRMIETED
jgi:hypothetical protein